MWGSPCCAAVVLPIVLLACVSGAAGGGEEGGSVQARGASKRPASAGTAGKLPLSGYVATRGVSLPAPVAAKHTEEAQNSEWNKDPGGARANGSSPSQQTSVLRTLLEVRLRFEARRLQAGLRTRRSDEDGNTTAGADPPNGDGKIQRNFSLREIREAKRRRDAMMLYGNHSEANVSVAHVASPGREARSCAESQEDEQEWECIVCGEALVGRVLGQVDCNSSHVFCFECIHKWGSSIENSCPLCKQSFRKIDKLILAPQDLWAGRHLSNSAGRDGMRTLQFAGKRWKAISSVSVEEKRQRVEEMVPDEEGCAECGGGSASGILIMCDGCDVSLCLDCADLTQDTMPRESEPWFCQECDESEEATGDRRRRQRRQARRQAQNEQEGRGAGGRGRQESGQGQTRQQRCIGEDGARRAARALGRNYRSHGRSMDQILDGFVVDDGEAFLSQDEDWVPPDDSVDSPGGWVGARGTRSRPIATRYPTRTRSGGVLRSEARGRENEDENESLGRVRRVAVPGGASGRSRRRTGTRVSSIHRAGGGGTRKRRRRRMASLSEDSEEEEEASVWEPHGHLMAAADDDFIAPSDHFSEDEEEEDEQEEEADGGSDESVSREDSSDNAARSPAPRAGKGARRISCSDGSSTQAEQDEDYQTSVSANL